MTDHQPAFVWFEFDAEVAQLWQSLTAHSPSKTFAFQKRLISMVGEGAWSPTLDSLKVLDVFLASVKSDLANKHASEISVISHPEFVKLLCVLCFHVVKVLQKELPFLLDGAGVELYAAQGFSRLYARTFAGLSGDALTDEQKDAFYQGFGILATGENALGKTALPLFILPVIGARLFGTIDRVFYGLDATGKPVATEDSLYWAVSDFLQAVQKTQGETAKALFTPRPIQPTVIPVVDDLPDVSNTPEPVPVATPTPQPSPPPAPSAHKQKARQSHTPKLFAEVYQDLTTLSMPSDSHESYQKAVSVLDKFDKFIADETAKGKNMDELTFTDSQETARKTALGLLVELIKNGNASAMTRLGVYLFEGRGLPADTKKATALIKKSAEMGDVRAQKLLSRLYYQGFDADNGGIAPDQMMGEHWLKKAADSGHPEAKKVCAYMNQIEVLKENYRTETQSDKRYGMIFLSVGVVMLLIIIIVSVFA